MPAPPKFLLWVICDSLYLPFSPGGGFCCGLSSLTNLRNLNLDFQFFTFFLVRIGLVISQLLTCQIRNQKTLLLLFSFFINFSEYLESFS